MDRRTADEREDCMLRKILGSVREYKKLSIATPILEAMEVAIECVIPFLIALLVNEIKAGCGMGVILRYGGLLALMALLSLLFGGLAGVTCARASCGLARNLRRDLFYSVQRFSFENIDKFLTSSLVTRMTTDVTNVQNAYMMLIRTAIRAPMMLIFAFSMAFIMAERMALEGIDLHIKSGETIGVIGGTGSSKSSLIQLISRLYDATEGTVKVGGRDVRAYDLDSLRNQVAMVLQKNILFSGTIRENLRWGNRDASDAECIAAAKLAGADDFITRLPEGYQTMLTGNGANLSQGQRQLLSIARAAVADPPVMILDEATSSIDTRTEAIVQRGMDALMKGRTVFVIAHRLSTVKNANVIIVLDHGRIIERGDHEALLKQKGQYYQLYTGAFELE